LQHFDFLCQPGFCQRCSAPENTDNVLLDAIQSDILWNQVVKNSYSKQIQSALASFTAGFCCRWRLKTEEYIQWR